MATVSEQANSVADNRRLGWVRLYRSFFTSEHYRGVKPEWRDCAMALIAFASYDSERRTIKGKIYDVTRGTLVGSRRYLADLCDVSEQCLRSALKFYEKLGFWTVKSTSDIHTITITNYDAYQSDSTQANQQLTSVQPAANQQLTQIKEIKNIRKNKSRDAASSEEQEKPPAEDPGSNLLEMPPPAPAQTEPKTGEVINRPRWLVDELYLEFVEEWKKAQPNVLEEDFTEAYFSFSKLDPSQKLKGIEGVRRRIAAGQFDPARPQMCGKPANYWRKEYKRDIPLPEDKHKEHVLSPEERQQSEAKLAAMKRMLAARTDHLIAQESTYEQSKAS